MEEISLPFLSCRCLLKIRSSKFIPLGGTPFRCSCHKKKHYRLKMHILGPCQYLHVCLGTVLQHTLMLSKSPFKIQFFKKELYDKSEELNDQLQSEEMDLDHFLNIKMNRDRMPNSLVINTMGSTSINIDAISFSMSFFF